MFAEILAAMAIGIFFGIFTGLIPGVHINLVAAIVLSVSPFLVQYVSPFPIAAGIMAMSITHVFVDFIPSIFLGAPSEATALAVLPGHRLLMEGKGFEAVFLSAVGGFLGVIAIVVLLPLIVMAVKHAFPFLKPHIGIILAGIVFFNVLRERNFRSRLWVMAVIALAGTLGWLTLNLPNLEQPLLPLLAGLFGISTLIASTLKNSPVPVQEDACGEIKKSAMAKSVSAGAFSGGLIGIFPALGPAQAAMLARELIGKAGKRQYLITLGAVSTSSMLFGLITLFTIDKARNGSIAILSEIVPVGFTEFLLLTLTALTACGFSAVFTLSIARIFAASVYRINYRYASYAIIIFIVCLTFYFSQLTGLAILFTGAAVGLLTITLNVARHNLMSCLMIPVLAFYFF